MRGHGVTQTTDKELDPEMVCTRVMARLIEDIGCVAIAPDSPPGATSASTALPAPANCVFTVAGVVSRRSSPRV